MTERAGVQGNPVTLPAIPAPEPWPLTWLTGRE